MVGVIGFEPHNPLVPNERVRHNILILLATFVKFGSYYHGLFS